ncbi:hypothetical protein EEJ42_02100 [Streptomyces botrytidirepellens]|uniref:Uncharacterized protein n=1 Tax=Streptomyces botrytidirepellens TaxID=2486417 RepID=A0A3M8XC19_9ACTN|nr:hypothetical protein [Streptomyces botrytidirepellens]RNG38013.1 hypothetical protein EEJ42_02100 [Streptomyces botrytidirepellens]
MFPETPIYSRLIAERGDIPARARDEADRLHRLQEQVFSSTSNPGHPQNVGTAPHPPRTSPSPPDG